MLKIKEVADLSGISKRTLHYYDDIGLLCPSKTSSGYRLYDSNNLEDLQQILFFRELGFSLKAIGQVMTSSSFNRKKALMNHKQLLKEKRDKIDIMMETIDKTLESMEGERSMSNKERFEGFNFSSKDPYQKEAREKWGNKALKQSKKTIRGNEKEMSEEMNKIYWELSAIRHLAPESKEAQAAIGKWFDFLNRIGSYSLDAFEGLGKMYVEDERFKNNIDNFGEGLSIFMKDSMKIYAKNNK